MIDCTKTENYFAEKRRMTKKHKLNGGAYICGLNCTDCPLNSLNNGTSISCSDFETFYPEKAITFIQKWSDEHPQKTYLTELLKTFPNAQLNTNGTPKEMCPHELGLNEIEDCGKTDNACVKCWSQPLPIEDGEE